jgi:uncharacterized protein
MDNKFELLADNSIRIAIIGTLAILALFLFIETVSTAQGIATPTNAPADTITVNGTGQATLPPDIANITFTVEQTAASVASAQAAVTKQANAAIAYVAAQGVASADVTTLSYNINPQYSTVYPPPCGPGTACPVIYNTPAQVENSGTPTITGYQVAETVQVTVRNLANVGTLLSGLGSQGVQSVSGPDFALEDPSQGPDAARAAAITNAEQQAQILATQLGVHLGRIVDFSDNDSGGAVYPMAFNASAGAASAPAAPNVPAGQNTYSDTVSITYSIH